MEMFANQLAIDGSAHLLRPDLNTFLPYGNKVPVYPCTYFFM